MNDLLRAVYDVMDQKQAEDLVVIDFRGYSPFLDYFVIGSARNARMARAILEAVEEKCDELGVTINSKDYSGESKWYLLDAGTLVCHVFYDGERDKYDLEGLWKDLPTVDM